MTPKQIQSLKEENLELKDEISILREKVDNLDSEIISLQKVIESFKYPDPSEQTIQSCAYSMAQEFHKIKCPETRFFAFRRFVEEITTGYANSLQKRKNEISEKSREFEADTESFQSIKTTIQNIRF